jgi:hypothetical protein
MIEAGILHFAYSVYLWVSYDSQLLIGKQLEQLTLVMETRYVSFELRTKFPNIVEKNFGLQTANENK